MSGATIVADEPGIWRVEGVLQMRSVRAVLEASARLPSVESQVVDLAGVKRVDSSAVALLLEWLREARARNRQIRYRNVPADLLSIARLCGVEALIPLDGPRT